ncbi:box C/D snoRNA protein 1 [Phymastichus coffea]|uniref:box C/D snoRNA protein 1 n=1 Tax=Phymastichus coffea TaxID=108790 RepID=UPI00273B6C31|nr:box C/D snoRNA protein 1 [Phymastichus coffea]
MAASSKKLDTCEVCVAKKAKYTCPKCEVRTCCMLCVNIHKKELDCDGIRDKIKFIPLNSFTDLDMLSDYRLLESIGRSVEQLQRDPLKKCTRVMNLPPHLLKLKSTAYAKGIFLEFMPQHFSRHKENTTYLNFKTNEFFWRLELIFPHADNCKWVINRVLDKKRLSTVLEEILNPDKKIVGENEEYLNRLSVLQSKLKFYQSHGLTGLKALLRSEKVKKSDSRFFELDMSLSLRDNLKNKIIIEFPIVYITFKDHSDMFEVIDSDDEKVQMEVNRPKRGKRKLSETNVTSLKNHHSLKDNTTSFNYFFNTDFSILSDSEDESTEVSYKNNGALNIPDYNKLVNMKQ